MKTRVEKNCLAERIIVESFDIKVSISASDMGAAENTFH
jgi:hypothetical protein